MHKPIKPTTSFRSKLTIILLTKNEEYRDEIMINVFGFYNSMALLAGTALFVNGANHSVGQNKYTISGLGKKLLEW